MKVLLTGNQGYIGAVLTELLLARGYDVVGYDTGYYAACALEAPAVPTRQIVKDIRDVTAENLQGVDAVAHLAALSNDPLGELAPELTDQINRDASITLARLAKAAGVRRFVYASSQSMYGTSDIDAELDEDASSKNPVTAYARTKWEAEQELRKLADKRFTVVCLRPSTVFGASPMLRSDIVFNNLVGCAYTTGKIEIKSDGTPWRPVVHVRDVASAFIAGLEAPAALVNAQAFNVGIPDGNFTVRDLAQAARRAVPGSTLVFTGEHGQDARTYRVSFAKILTVLKDYYRPQWDLDRGGRELVDFYKRTGFSEGQFRGSMTNRLKCIGDLVSRGLLGADLRRQSGAVVGQKQETAAMV
ncbi:MAG: NAD(P)-dependent oxidoreductase [bacterium]|nr:NAD(P)-dependent oxidoreductase [bacterium]MDZ4296315.1 NAD(P)-dependent oxidoreductase [Patescibacteria group bacterium]